MEIQNQSTTKVSYTNAALKVLNHHKMYSEVDELTQRKNMTVFAQ